MHLDKVVLSIMSQSRADYNKLKDNPAVVTLSPATQHLLSGLEAYYSVYDADAVDNDMFKIQFFDIDKVVKQDEAAYYSALINTSFAPIDSTARDGVLKQLREAHLAGQLAGKLQAYERGDEVSLYDDMELLCKEFDSDLRRIKRDAKVTKSIGEILREMNTGPSYTFSLKPLSDAIPHMRHGHQIIIGARPGTGKTSFISHELVHWARAVPEGRCIAYFNNESKGEYLKPTLYRAMFKVDEDTLAKYTDQQLDEAWAAAGGNNIQIFDVQGFSIYDIEYIIQAENPAICIFDMVDNIKGFADQARADLRLEELYKWSREAAVIHDFLSLPVSQLSVEAEGEPWPDKSMLKDSKTAKQGACDAIVNMGADTKSLFKRYFHVAKLMKAKTVAGCTDPSGRCEVDFLPDTCEFKSPVPIMKFN